MDPVLRMKEFFFDRVNVLTGVSKRNAAALSKFGAYVRQRARSSIRKRARTSKPGESPSSHVGTLRDLTFFAYEPESQDVVIGPTPVGAVGIVPPTIEFGGVVGSHPNPRHTERRVGDGGEIRIIGKSTLSSHKKQRINRPWLKKNKDGVWVAYMKLKTAAQVAKANELNVQLYGPAILPAKEYAARPWMGPAFVEEQKNLPAIWSAVAN